MLIGISAFLTKDCADVATIAKKVEELGFESLWLPEHPIFPAQASTPWSGPGGVAPKYYAEIVDPIVALARASAVTTRLRLGTGVCLVPERNPLLLAKEIATLDVYSGGRFLFGIGAGWNKEETAIMGGDFAHRWTQTREAIIVIKTLWASGKGEFHGHYYDFPPVYSLPQPIQHPNPPIFLGGNAPNVFKRVVAWGDGWMPNRVTPDEVRDGRKTLDRLAKQAGRNPTSIKITLFGQQPDLDLIRDYQQAGADRILIGLAPSTEKEAIRELENIAKKVMCEL